MPQIGGADIFSAGAFRRLSLDGATVGLTPAPTTRVHDPSGVGTHGEALASAEPTYSAATDVIGAGAGSGDERRIDS
jgi:hypothetical protein